MGRFFFGVAVAAMLLISMGGRGAHAGIVVVYVNDDATGANNGTSWKDAYTNLQTALLASGPQTVIWVAGGTYKPSTGTTRFSSFTLKPGVYLYGGFTGTESTPGGRDPSAPPSILSGDLGTVSATDNSFHVVTVPTGVNAGLDGFVIEKGYAGGTGDFSHGGGIWIVGDAPLAQLTNLWIRNNQAPSGGGGIWAKGQVNAERLQIEDNFGGVGGGVLVDNADFDLDRATFQDNVGTTGAGVALIGTSTSAFQNTTFYDQHAFGAAAIDLADSSRLLVNYGTIYANVSGSGAVIRTHGNATDLEIAESIIWSNSTAVASADVASTLDIIHSVIPICPVGVTCANPVSSTGSPLVTPPAAHHDFVRVFSITPLSAAADAGGGMCPEVDGRSAGRAINAVTGLAGKCDLGAFEYWPMPFLYFNGAEASQSEADYFEGAHFFVGHTYPDNITFVYKHTGGTAIPGKDFSTTAGQAVIQAGLTNVLVPLDFIDDKLYEKPETIEVSVSNLVNAKPSASTTFELTLTSDDPSPTVTFSKPASSGPETAGKPEIDVALSAASGLDTKIDYAVTGGTASEGSDYKPVGGVLVIPAGDTSGKVRLTVLNDWTPEPDETLVLQLKSVNNGTIGTAKQHTYTITNDDDTRTCQGQKVTIYGTPGKDKLIGTPRRDVIDGLGGDDLLWGSGGNDVICGSGGKDVLRGGPGNDVLNAKGGADKVFGGGGDDTLLGAGGPDTLRGELGRDRLAGGPGNPDVCDGGPSTDILLPAHGCESVIGVP